MYGMVNKAVQHLIVTAHGLAMWEKIRVRAGIQEASFVALQSYPDEVTYNLVGAICAELNAPPESVLETFGESWVAYSSSQGYGPMLDFFGKDLKSLLRNLDAMHTRLKSIFPHLNPPQLGYEEISNSQIRLHYRSHRAGLTHFVVGLVRGMGKRFKQSLTIRIEESKANGADHDTFIIELIDENSES